MNNYDCNELKTRILNIIKVASYRDNFLAAYKARKLCYRICKEESDRPDYKEYVENIILNHFPNEFKKAQKGRCFVNWMWIGVVSLLPCVISLTASFAVLYGFLLYFLFNDNGVLHNFDWVTRMDCYELLLFLGVISIIWGVYVIKKLYTSYKSIKDLMVLNKV